MRDFVDLYPFLKQSVVVLNIVFYWNNNLKLCFSLADTAVKNRLKYLINIKTYKSDSVFTQRFFKIQNYCFTSPTVLYACQSKTNNFI